jgi:hypothetical protein
VEALALILASLAKKGKRGAKAPIKTSTSQAPHSASARGRKRNFVEAMADQALIDIGAGTSDELPFVIRQSFKKWSILSLDWNERDRVANNARVVCSEWCCCKGQNYIY